MAEVRPMVDVRDTEPERSMTDPQRAALRVLGKEWLPEAELARRGAHPRSLAVLARLGCAERATRPDKGDAAYWRATPAGVAARERAARRNDLRLRLKHRAKLPEEVRRRAEEMQQRIARDRLRLARG